MNRTGDIRTETNAVRASPRASSATTSSPTPSPSWPSRSPRRSTATSAASTTTSPSATPCEPSPSGRADSAPATGSGSVRSTRCRRSPTSSSVIARARGRHLLPGRRRRRGHLRVQGHAVLGRAGRRSGRPSCTPARCSGILELTEKERPRTVHRRDETSLVRRMASLAGIALHNARTTARRWRSATASSRPSSTPPGPCSRRSTSTRSSTSSAARRHAPSTRPAATSTSTTPRTTRIDLAGPVPAATRPTPSRTPLGTVYPSRSCPQSSTWSARDKPAEVRLDDPFLSPRRQGAARRAGASSRSLIVPLVVGDAVVGALEVGETAYPRHFSEQETALCVALGEQAAAAIHNAQLYRRLQRAEGHHRAAGHHRRASPAWPTTGTSGRACATRSRVPAATVSRSPC